jgi:hypothetical protein
MDDQYGIRHVMRPTLNEGRRWSGGHAWGDHTSSVAQGMRPSPHVWDGMYLGAVGEHGDRRCEEDIEDMRHALEDVHGSAE